MFFHSLEGPPERRGLFFLSQSLEVQNWLSYLWDMIKTNTTMSQQELNQLHGLLTTFKRTMLTEAHTVEDLHAVCNAAFIVAETKPNS